MTCRKLALAFFSAAVFITQPVLAADNAPNTGNSIITDFDIIGIAQNDYSRVTGDNTAIDTDKLEVRRGRIGFKATLYDAVKVKAELDLDDPSDPNLIDAYIAFNPTSPLTIKLGQFKTANSLDEQTSSKKISTFERAGFTDAFQLARGVGAAAKYVGARHTLEFGIFGRDLEDDVLQGLFVGGRATYEPIVVDDLQVHTGISFRYRELSSSQTPYEYSQKPVANPAGAIVNTGEIARSDLFYGAEVAVLKGRFWGAAEYGALRADCITCLSDPTFPGAYIEVGAFFNGKKTLKAGSFGTPKIYGSVKDGGIGAFSAVVRWDTLDLNDAGISGGYFETITLGADWWATPNVRLGINVYKVDVEFGNVVNGLDAAFATAIANGVTTEDATGVTVRFQVHI